MSVVVTRQVYGIPNCQVKPNLGKFNLSMVLLTHAVTLTVYNIYVIALALAAPIGCHWTIAVTCSRLGPRSARRGAGAPR